MKKEFHRSHRSNRLRAAVLGANDGLLSTASLILGVAAAQSSRAAIAVAGFSGLVSGALAMAAGEYVSVSSQADVEEADLALERKGLLADNESERAELALIYQERGLTPALAREVADQFMSVDALGAHARDELGFTDMQRARPVQAAATSAASFALGALAPLLVALLVPSAALPASLAGASLLGLALLGASAAWAGGANIWKGAARVLFWGAFAMGAATLLGQWVGRRLS